MLPKRTIEAVLVHLLNQYYHRRPEEAVTTTSALARGNRAVRPPEAWPVDVKMSINDCNYGVVAEGDPRTAEDLIKELAQARYHTVRNQGAERTIVERLVALLKLPRPVNYLTIPSVAALQDSLLRPDEVTTANFLEKSKGQRCFRCGVELTEHEAVTFHGPEWTGDGSSAVVCGGCERPTYIKCAKELCTNRILLDATYKFCTEHQVNIAPVAPRAPRVPPILDEQGAFDHVVLRQMAEQDIAARNQVANFGAAPIPAENIFFDPDAPENFDEDFDEDEMEDE